MLNEATVTLSAAENESPELSLDDFLATYEQRAYRIAYIALHDHDEALDVVQDSMIKLVNKYAQRPSDEWCTLFFTILHNRITDSHRKNTLHSRLFGWFGRFGEQESEDDKDLQPLDRASQPIALQPMESLQAQETMTHLEAALNVLPLRQQQAFLLRMVEGMDTRATSEVMGCSTGSVKTHLSRALASLKEALKDHYESS